ncbi:acetyltransferase [Solimicrobium silvestre]|uniref:Sugar O-acyltransferase, sialic acid O-acetyltransferase NeuD family n=1 Tax=Solimicrobium silvestre TaxID=2099400 RepID=A0A2S9H0Q1_9BURK|nr:acetyltransferase [Solimicrobium silvestre]PRC93547.1 Sugar O-acyltransferase, sialic acid O-acetyltransferase NeuD family [Solimicrobium silvestre]
MKKIVFGLIGAGGSGREVMPFVKSSICKTLSVPPGIIHVYFVETWEPENSKVNGYPLISLDDFFALDGDKYFNIAIGDGRAREAMFTMVAGKAEVIEIHSPRADFLENNSIGIGSVFCPNSMITSDVKIGKFFQANIFSSVSHDCVIGDFVTLSPGARCNGRVIVGDYAFIGANAVIKEGKIDKPLRIGKGAVVGMGAVVTKDVPDGVTVVGNPARPIKKNKPLESENNSH